ncbi:hypothetical protein ACIG8S_04410 [[Kitasatospora] papulosa]|uniref:hypothetical protein n=1 Tax=[Kitasatospora] papulosa TaxID=1464011 RepID=UPI0037CEE4FC
MGIFSSAKPQAFVESAQVRFGAGHTVYTIAWEGPSGRIGPLDEFSNLVELVEAEGWRLDRVEPLVFTGGRPTILLVFRR